MKGSVKRFGVSVGSRFLSQGRVVNLEGDRLLFRRVLGNLAVLRSPLLGALVAGVSFSSTNSVVSA